VTETDPETVLKTSKRKHFVIFIIVNDMTAETQAVRYVLQQSILPFLPSSDTYHHYHAQYKLILLDLFPKSLQTAPELLKHNSLKIL